MWDQEGNGIRIEFAIQGTVNTPSNFKPLFGFDSIRPWDWIIQPRPMFVCKLEDAIEKHDSQFCPWVISLLYTKRYKAYFWQPVLKKCKSTTEEFSLQHQK